MSVSKHNSINKIALVALMSALNVILTVLGNLYFFLLPLLLLFLPVISIVTLLKTDYKNYLIYFVTSILLSLILSFHDFSTTLFYLFPALILGLVIGATIKTKLPPIYIILIGGFTTFLLFYLMVPVYNVIYEINYLTFLYDLLKIKNETQTAIFPSIVLLVSLLESTFTYLITIYELKNFLELNMNDDLSTNLIVDFAFILISSLFATFSLQITYIFLFITFALTVYLVVSLFNKSTKVALIFTAVFVVSLIISFPIALTFLEQEYMLFSLFLPLVVVVFSMSLWLYIRYKKKGKFTIR
jgi:hypothetical protein